MCELPRITIVSHIFHPDELGGAALMTDLALFLRETGMEVNVVSTFPYYPRWQLALEDQGVWRRTDHFEGIPIRRVRMHVPSTPSTSSRLFSDFSFLFSLTFLGRRGWKNADVIVTTCPMFGQTMAMRFATPFRSVPKLVIVQDFVVDAALELGMIRSPFLGKILKGLERWAFRSCSTLTTISGEMLKKLETIAGSDRRTLLIPNWIHGSLAKSIEARRAAAPPRQRNFLFYSGNVGRKQGLPDFLSSFDGTRSGWRIRINGSGAEFDQLKEPCSNRADVSLHGLEDEGAYIDSLLSCSACLVTQKAGVGANFLPSKILPALASGTPILAVCEKGSPLGREVIEADCGVVIEAGDAAGLHAALQSWADDPDQLKRYSRNALARAQRYERNAVLSQYRDEILALAGKQPVKVGTTAPAREVSDEGSQVVGRFSEATPAFLLIGGSGFIGYNLARRLHERHPGARIVLADLVPPSPAALPPGIEFLLCDVRKNLEAQLGRARYDCIYNLAAIHREPGHAEGEYYETNVGGATHVCEYAALVDCRKLVFSSSIAVYGKAETGLTEQASKSPVTAYGISKQTAEGIHEKWQAGAPVRKLRIIRPGVVYGPGDIGNMLRMIRAVKKGYFFFPGSARNKKSFAYIEGLLDSIEFAEKLPDPLFTYNYVEKDTIPFSQLVAIVSQFFNRRAPVLRIPRGALIAIAHVFQWVTFGKSSIHPVRVEKAGISTWVIPQALLDRGFNFRFDFAASLRDWQQRAPEDFR